jgi:hypothetical protein
VDLLSALPMAFVMIAGTQIIRAIMLATSTRARANSVGFLAGVAAATTLGLSLFHVLADQVHPEPSESSSASTALNLVMIVLLLVLAGLAYKNRANTEPPARMSKL